MIVLKRLFPQYVKNIFHRLLALCASVWFGFPASKLRVIGITGTDGKTTTVQCISAILRAARKRVAVASTINFRIGDRQWVNASKFTTLSSWKLQKFLRQAVSDGCEYAVVEVSSHALDQGRIWGMHFDVAVITNVTREHLDYHKTMNAYRRAKRKLFECAENGVINFDMEDPSEFFCNTLNRRILYSRCDASADVYAENIVTRIDGSTFSIDGVVFSLALPGVFNVENALAAISVADVLGISRVTSATALAELRGVPGRMEYVANDRHITILIDYAVTPNALEKLYSLVRSIRSRAQSRIIAVFGACGDRDRGKRSIMGKIVSSYVDDIILTNEDPYTEDPEKIVRDVQRGIEHRALNEHLWVIMDRREAIRKALHMATPGDIVVVTGKGAEETMMIGHQLISWNDKRVIEELLEGMREGHKETSSSQ